jgi:hypothetical protein
MAARGTWSSCSSAQGQRECAIERSRERLLVLTRGVSPPASTGSRLLAA